MFYLLFVLWDRENTLIHLVNQCTLCDTRKASVPATPGGDNHILGVVLNTSPVIAASGVLSDQFQSETYGPLQALVIIIYCFRNRAAVAVNILSEAHAVGHMSNWAIYT
jgi:hypothetical protein